MSKSKKKLSRRFKRTVGFSLAGLFLISAVIVALIPQKSTKAYTADAGSKTFLEDSENEIPIIDDTVDKIYTNGDGFQFAYKNKNLSTDKIAIICGYDYQRALDGGNLTIPNTVDAYKKYTDSYGTSGGYVAVSMNDEFLFYPTYEKVVTMVDSGEVDENGDPIMVENVNYVINGYLPCYVETKNNWYYNERNDNKKREPEEYYYESSPGNFEACIDQVHQRITDIDVLYIANQNVISNTSGTGPDWLLSGDDTLGIFSKANNIVNIKFGDKLLGIGNYAFKGCANLNKVEFTNGIITLGNYAFADCYNLETVTIPLESLITVIGQNTFANCQSLKTFNLPSGVTKVGDSCFEGCINLETCVLDAPNKQMALNEMGKNVFKGCSSLTGIAFPALYNENQDVAWFEECTSLKYITIPNPNMKLYETTVFSFEDFKAQVPEEFYLEGLKDKELHKVSTANSFAFKYLNEEVYEKVFHEDNNPSNDRTKVVFRVDNQNELIFFEMGEDATVVNIPNKIGPYGITKIGSDSFANNCTLKKVTISSNIVEIEAGAFKGCHNLKDVIFEEPINVSLIGEGAFDTQITGPQCKCTSIATPPVLTFTGNAKKGSAPFEYAMNKSNNINNDEQPETYITFYTGWPSNLTVRYNPNTEENELVDLPTKTNLSTYTATSFPYMNNTYASAATSAYNMLDAGAVPSDSTPQNVKEIYYATVSPVLPDGITSIKEGLFSGLDKEGNPITGMVPNDDIFSIEMNGVKKIDPFAFKDCDSLANVKVNDGLESLGDYAFESCDSLANVEIYSDLREFGKVPFLSCKNLNNDIVFKAGDNTPFECQDLIVYSKVNGVKDAILEVLGSRGNGNNQTTSNINPSVFSTINTIAEEAFKDCDGVTEVDFSQSNIKQIPKSCFEDTDDLYKVILKDGTTTIGPDAFKNSNIKIVEIPRSVSVIDNTAFDGDPQQITFRAEKDSPAAYFADSYSNIILEEIVPKYHVTFYDLSDPADPNSIIAEPFAGPFTVDEGANALDLIRKDPSKDGWIFVGWQDEDGLKNVTKDINTRAIYKAEDPEEIVYYTVRFIDTYDNSEFLKETVEKGKDCELIKLKGAPDHLKDGYKFEGWLGDITNVTENRTIYTQYETFDVTAEFTVTFLDWDDTVLYTQKVKAGEDCIDPKDPKREGYTFTGWRPSIKAITKDTTVYAQYEKIESSDPDKKDDNTNPDNKDNKDNNNTDNKDNNGNNNNNNGNGNNNNGSSNTPTLYTVTVVDGTGSGSYVQGANVIILANNAPSGKVFDKWVVDEGVSLVKAELAANYFVMPAKNVTVKATYKDDTSNKNNSNNSNNGGNGNTSNAVKPNTTVSLTKGGFSNNNIASASVVGSSDNYVLKITDSQTAKAEVEDALLSKYDSLDNIKYVAMDISLYDSTGSVKIENTSDLKVSVTIPIPDDLVPYAGNNRVAYVVNGKLVDLNPKFTTINGVPCINFTAPHFSPYTIYVDTSNLSSSVSYTPTSTPKTGDGLSAKWYISIALFAASIIFFALCIPSGKKKKVSSR
ncbi:MAG: leucine-rich repeat protein [Lachnospiraceae bacterium]|nr:leucine-rich repeat protein [Lachnospiraceae bacterium]